MSTRDDSPPLEAPSHNPHPTCSPLPLANQVGGHAGVLTSEDGSILIKPSLPLELQFYQNLQSDTRFAPLRPFIPKFLGTLRLEGEMGGDGVSVQPLSERVKAGKEGEEGKGGEGKESLVLENLAYGFVRPNILDVKLGTVLYDESANKDKVERMKKTARETTSEECGVRLTGFQVYNNATSTPTNTPKSYGKSLKPSDLPSGFGKFFPIPTPSDPHGLPSPLLLPILEGIKDDVSEIREALTQVHMRMVGASLLIIYEAEWEKAKEGVEYWLRAHGDEEDELDSESDESSDSGEVESGEGEGKEKKKKKPKPPYIVKLIDFAHTRIKPGEGPDEGVLKGVDTVLELIGRRIEEVKALEG